MFQHSRRRFLAGFALLGGGTAIFGRGAFAQTATGLQCGGPIMSKAITGLKPSYSKGGVYQNLSYGGMAANAQKFGHQSDFTLIGKPGKFAKGISLVAGTNSTLKFNFFRGSGPADENLSINIELQSIKLGSLYNVYADRVSIEVPALKGVNASPSVYPDPIAQTVKPSVRFYATAPWGGIKSKLPKGSDFSAKVMVDGKAIATIIFPKLALAKIVDALNKENDALAGKLAADPSLTGDLTYKTLPAGCTITKGSSGSSGCYLTTAAVDIVGLPDDCWELRQLRAFRDRFAKGSSQAASMMAEYYTHAPSVVNRINARPDAKRIWLNAYWRGIVPAALASQLRLDGVARAIYVRWTRKLQAIAE